MCWQIGQRGFPDHLGFAKNGREFHLSLIANDNLSRLGGKSVKSRQ